jgi:Ca-activated chloride channel homolog
MTMTTPTLLLTPRRPALLAGHDNEIDLLVRIQAPDAPPGIERHPLHLALVIDRSGSMSGRPLAEAKRCAEFVLDGLTASDRLSLIAYDNDVQTLIAAQPLSNKDAVRRAIRSIAERGSTNLHGGWLQGAESLAPHTSPASISRVILLSDGCANQGLTDPRLIEVQCAALAAADVTTSTYGLGHHFNEDLMVGMARHGGGNSYYGETAEDLMDPFREEFELLNAVCARRLELEVEPGAGINVQMLNDYVSTAREFAEDAGRSDRHAWRLPDLAFGSEAWAVLRLRVPATLTAAEDSPERIVQLASISVRYATLDGEPRAIQPQTLAVPVLPASAFNAIADDELVVRRASELEAARLQAQAREHAQRGDWDGVARSVACAARLAEQSPWVGDVVDAMQDLAAQRDTALFAKEALYSARRMSTRLAAQAEEPSAASDEALSFLRRKRRQGREEGKDSRPRR